MAPKAKKAAGKHPREHSLELEHIEFAIPEHQAQFEHLSKLKFRKLRFPVLSMLREIQLGDDMVDKVDELLLVDN